MILSSKLRNSHDFLMSLLIFRPPRDQTSQSASTTTPNFILSPPLILVSTFRKITGSKILRLKTLSPSSFRVRPSYSLRLLIGERRKRPCWAKRWLTLGSSNEDMKSGDWWALVSIFVLSREGGCWADEDEDFDTCLHGRFSSKNLQQRSISLDNTPKSQKVLGWKWVIPWILEWQTNSNPSFSYPFLTNFLFFFWCTNWLARYLGSHVRCCWVRSINFGLRCSRSRTQITPQDLWATES